jgi:hypothetical protein
MKVREIIDAAVPISRLAGKTGQVIYSSSTPRRSATMGSSSRSTAAPSSSTRSGARSPPRDEARSTSPRELRPGRQ